jgi:Tol biopolymer transport system component
MVKKSLLIFVLFTLFNTCNTSKSVNQPDNQIENGVSTSFYFSKPSFLKTLVTSAKAIVSATDMDTLEIILTVTDSSVFGTIENIPSGLDRKFEVYCFDDLMNLTYYGSQNSDVEVNVILTLNIILYPINHTGTVIILGSFSPFPIKGQKIAFQADNAGTYDIYIMDDNGTNIVQLTNSNYEDYYPIISPDLSTIVFMRRENSVWRPYLMNIDGSNLQHLNILPNANMGSCDWSPDGSKFALHANEDGDPDIYIHDLITEITTQIVANNAIDWIPRWSPDGNKIVFYSDMNGMFKTYTINPDGTGLSILTPNNDTEEKVASYSPDGNRIVMSGRNIYSQWGIFTVNADGSNFFEVLNTQGVNEHHPVWSPDGMEILFKRSDGGVNGYGLYLVNPDGTNLRVLLDTQYNEFNPHWR